MANGGIIRPVNDPTISDLTQTFTASGTFNMPNSGPAPGQADYLVVAGGGGGGSWCGAGGGGGAGGYRTSFPGGTKLTITKGSATTVTVGAGGAGTTINNKGCNGTPFNIFNNHLQLEEVEVEDIYVVQILF
jgi:hypothetical protein